MLALAKKLNSWKKLRELLSELYQKFLAKLGGNGGKSNIYIENAKQPYPWPLAQLTTG